MGDVLLSGRERQATTRISPFQGFHFIISDLITPNEVQSPVQDGNCAFYILHGLPSDVFIDPYELNQRIQDRIMPSFVGIWGETDLELPVATVDPDRGSSILFGPFSPVSSARDAPPDHMPYRSEPKGGAAEILEIDFPLHARYPLPTNITAPFKGHTHAMIHIPVPALLHVCERLTHEDVEAQSVQQTAETLNVLTDLAPSFVSPFDTGKSTIHVSYPFKALAAEGTAAAAAETSLPLGNASTLTIRVPTGAFGHLAFVQPVTLLAMSVCAAYVAYTAILVATSRGVTSVTRSLQGHGKRKVE